MLNTVALAMDHYGISDRMSSSLSTANIVFSTVFGVEMLVKLAGGWTGVRASFLLHLP